MLSQELLRNVLADRIRSARPELGERFDLDSPAGQLGAQAEITAYEPERGAAAVAVLSRFDLTSWVRTAVVCAQALDPAAAAAWRRDFTRTVFLAGNPRNLVDRFRFDHIAEDLDTAWLGPTEAAASEQLRRQLRLFDGRRAVTDLLTPGASAPGATVGRDLYVATAGVPASDCLIHVTHLVTEAVLDGLLTSGDRLIVQPRPYLESGRQAFAALRVGAADGTRPGMLRAYAALGTSPAVRPS
ncbi:DUF6182 family protein [Streptomyces sp. NPDC001852]|uniref:DUF6182 family protein n=1 Tax=Streptomyces sp. NPDC001852 TaxID=3364619 RepID=UPI0036AD1C01